MLFLFVCPSSDGSGEFPGCAGSSQTLLLDYAISTVNPKYSLTSYIAIRSLYRHVVCNVTPVNVYTPVSVYVDDIGFVRVHQAFFMRPPVTLNRQGGCPKCPEFSLGENSKWFVLSCLRKYYDHIS